MTEICLAPPIDCGFELCNSGPDLHYFLMSKQESFDVTPSEVSFGLGGYISEELFRRAMASHYNDDGWVDYLRDEYLKYRNNYDGSTLIKHSYNNIEKANYNIGELFIEFKTAISNRSYNKSIGKKSLIRANSPKFIRNTIKSSSFSFDYNKYSSIFVSGIVEFITDLSNSCLTLNEARRIFNSHQDDFQQVFFDDSFYKKTSKEIKKIKDQKIKSTKIFNKASSILKDSYPEYHSAFISKDKVKVVGNKYDFMINLKSISSHGYDSINTQLYNKKGDKLSDLCVYFEDTPAPEQLANMITMISHGYENEIIETGNKFSLTDAGRKEFNLSRPNISTCNISNDCEVPDWSIGICNSIDNTLGYKSGFSRFHSNIDWSDRVKEIFHEDIKNKIYRSVRDIGIDKKLGDEVIHLLG